MSVRSCLRVLLFVSVIAPIVGCNSSEVDSLAVSPASQALTVGQTVQFTAVGTYGHGSSHPAVQHDVTSQVTWTSSAPSVATISSTGLATAMAAGTTTITASMNGFTGLITATATLTVSGTSGGGGGGGGGTTVDIVSISVIPNAQTVAAPGDTAQFIPIGTTSTGGTVNLSGMAVWSSSSTQIATVGSSSGLATGVNKGTATITAVYTNADQTVATGTATFTVSGGSTEPITALTLLPASQSLSISQTGQFLALGTSGTTGLVEDVTNSTQLSWQSSIPSIATISTGQPSGNGLATGISSGSTTIEAVWKNPDGSIVTASGSLTVTTSAAPEPLLSINIVPTNVTVGAESQTQQYLAFGTYSTAPTVRDLTNQVTWISLAPQVVTITSGGVTGADGGLATAQGYTGYTSIYAEATNPDGTIVLSNPATFTCTDPTTKVCDPGPAPVTYATLTVYNEGTNTTDWLVTAPSATGTPDLIHCGPGSTSGGSVCVGTYPAGSTVTLQESGTNFNGWSANCDTSPNTPNLSSTCTVTLTGNDSVGAIFN